MKLGYWRGARGYRGRGQGRMGGGRWPGNGPFSHLPPWKRPGWLYGPGSCWTMGLAGSPLQPVAQIESVRVLQEQKNLMESQLESLQESLDRVEKRLKEIEESDS